MKQELFQSFLDKNKPEQVLPEQWNDFLFSVYELSFITSYYKMERPAILAFLLNYLIDHGDALYKGLLRRKLDPGLPLRFFRSEGEEESAFDLEEGIDILERNLSVHIPALVSDTAAYILQHFQSCFSINITSSEIDYPKFRKNMIAGSYEACAKMILDWAKMNDVQYFSIEENKIVHPIFPRIELHYLERYYEKTKDLELNLSLGLISEIDVLTMRNYGMPIGLPFKLFPFIVFNYIPLEILSLH